MAEQQAVSSDILEGAKAIAEFLFGPGADSRRGRTAIKHGVPHFRIGNRVFARKSAISQWIAAKEGAQQ